MNGQISPEVKDFYSMIAMLECAKSMHKYLVNHPNKPIADELRKEVNKIFTTYNSVKSIITRTLVGQEKETWEKEWTNRDYEAYASVFQMLSEMNDEQRREVELFAFETLKNGAAEEKK